MIAMGPWPSPAQAAANRERLARREAHAPERRAAEATWRDEYLPQIHAARKALARIEGLLGLTDVERREMKALDAQYEELEHAVAMLRGADLGPDYPSEEDEA